MMRDPFSGIGKPEPLRYGIAGGWSRRLTDEHRLVYRVQDDVLLLLQAPYRYTKVTSSDRGLSGTIIYATDEETRAKLLELVG